MRIKISEIEVDEDIYPRKQRSPTAVDSYVESLRVGDKFPTITVQKISVGKDSDNNEIVKTISLDGSHRLEAYEKYNKGIKDSNQAEDVTQFFDSSQPQTQILEPITEVEVEFWKDDVLDKQEWLEELRIVSYQLNMKHGVKVTDSDLEFHAGRIVDDRPLEKLTGIITELAKKFDKTPGRMSQLIGDKVRRRRATRDSLILKLSREGWTQQEIGGVIGLHQTVVGKINQNFNTKELINLFYEKGVSPEEIADTYRMDMATLWSILLEDKSDLERFKLFYKNKTDYSPDNTHAFNVWNFKSLDTRLGNKHEMNIPGQIAMHVLYYFTGQGDLVVDPMAGGGSTTDACLVMGRKCRAYDIEPIQERKDIQEQDIREGLDERVKGKADLIFLDPPYGDMVMFKDNKTFYEFMKTIADVSYNGITDTGKVALVMCDRTKSGYDPFISESYLIFKNAGFRCIQRISAPLTTQSATGDEINKARENKKLLGRDRVVYIFQKRDKNV